MANLFFVPGTIVFFLCLLFLLKALLSKSIGKELFLSCGRLSHPNTLSLYGFWATIIGLLLFDGDLTHCALIAYALASFLDGADGSMARALGKISDIGKWLDPLFDKFRHFSFLALFLHLRIVETMPLLAFFSADLVSQLSRVIIGKTAWGANKTNSANYFGKTKTVIADILIGYCFLLFWEPWVANYTSFVLFFLAALAVLSTVFKVFSFQAMLACFSNKKTSPA